MKKIIILSAALLGFNLASNAQSGPSTANQNVNLNLSNAIVITYNSVGGATNGTDVNIPFTTVADYQNGVIESGTEHLFVQSNLKFNVTVATTSTEFSFTGSGSNPHMPVSGVLAAQVFNNNTGGTIASGFSGAYGGLTSSSQSLLSTCTNGGNQYFDIKYKATPGFAYPAGTYTANVVYTATQM
jgi:hypothetical protein